MTLPIEYIKIPASILCGTNSNTSHAGRWLVRVGLWELVFGMMMFSQKYGLLLMINWEPHLNDPDWLERMMAKTFMLLNPEDKEFIRPKYADWLWFEKHVDRQALIEPEYNALCYLLDKYSPSRWPCNSPARPQRPG